MRRSIFIFSILGILLSFLWSENAHAKRIRFNVGGSKFTSATSPLTLSITVDSITPTVAVGTAADQSFRDNSVGASYFGYYLSTGVRTSGQAAGTTGKIQIQKAAGETAGRSYYLLGNGTSTPTAQSNLTIAPAVATTIATVPLNTTSSCGPNYATNGISGVNGLTCTLNPTVANMDVTEFVKVLWSDSTASAITASIQFIVVEN